MVCAATGFRAESAAETGRNSPPLTKLEVRRSPQDQVRRRILEQLSEALILPDQSGQEGRTPVEPLKRVYFWTRAYATTTPGLCRSDSLKVRFLPAGTENGAATPARAVGVETVRYYHFLREVKPEEIGSLDHRGLIAANAECAAIDVMNADSVNAEPDYANDGSDSIVVEAMWQARRVVRAAAGKEDLPFQLECAGDLANEKKTCRQELAEIDPEKDLFYVTPCFALGRNKALEGEGGARPCWHYSGWGGGEIRSLHIQAPRSDPLDKKTATVRLGKMFVILHEKLPD